MEPEIKKLTEKLEKMKREIYEGLTAWQRVQIARHPDRPYTIDYIRMIADDFIELHGDREFADDLAIIAGFAQINGTKVMVIGHQKGRDTKENIKRNFGCAHPEGYRKAMRLMEMAEKFGLICLKTPIVATVIGEGGSGGALGIGIADRICILQHAYYSVISPEGCASILWRNAVKAPLAAEALKITGEYLLQFGIVDEMIPEPVGGAHQDPGKMAAALKESTLKHLKALSSLPSDELLKQRYEKFRKIGEYSEN